MKKVLLHQDYLVAAWVADQLNHAHEYGNFSAIGLVDENELIAGLVFYAYQPGFCVYWHTASVPGRHWAVPEFMETARQYVFEQLNVPRLCAWIHEDDRKSLRLMRHLGFKKAGCFEGAGKQGQDLFLMTLHKDDAGHFERGKRYGR